ncbi:MAG TPA: response regulator [Spirochaetales bacterium]|nr:response regulator [Spirochaetales bacterium]
MYKIMIADDEPKIRNGLGNLLVKIDPEITIVAEAEDGETALSLAQQTVPDILFIDIRMPFMNGLELIQRLAEIKHDWIIIIVTGHDEFEYARKALSLKVFEYLLKPVEEENLRSTLERAKNELQVRKETNKYMVWAREKLLEHLGALREVFIRDWLSGKLSNTEIEEYSQFLSLTLPWSVFILAIRLEDRTAMGNSFQSGYRRLLLYAVKSILEDIFGSTALVVIDEKDNVLALLDYSKDEEIKQRIPKIEAAVYEATHLTPIIIQKSFHPSNGSSFQTIQEAYEAVLSELENSSHLRTFVLLAQSYIEKNYPYPELSLEETAQELQISPGYLSRLLKQATGFSFVEYVCRVRIKHALQLMEDPAAKIYEVAEKVGYRSQHYFSRAFRQVLGIAPTEYRKGGSSR